MSDRLEDDGFLSRWSQRKNRVRDGETVAEAPTAAVDDSTVSATKARPAPVLPSAGPDEHDGAVTANSASADKPLAPTLDDVARLTRDADFSRFVAADVDGGVRNAALHKLFSDPRFNVMDGLDIYIGDYNTPSPLPASMLRQMVQARALGLFDDEPDAHAADAAAPPPTQPEAPDEDADLRLQPLDAAGREGLEPGAGEDGAGQH
jgi:hypothetical protein